VQFGVIANHLRQPTTIATAVNHGRIHGDFTDTWQSLNGLSKSQDWSTVVKLSILLYMTGGSSAGTLKGLD